MKKIIIICLIDIIAGLIFAFYSFYEGGILEYFLYEDIILDDLFTEILLIIFVIINIIVFIFLNINIILFKKIHIHLLKFSLFFTLLIMFTYIILNSYDLYNNYENEIIEIFNYNSDVSNYNSNEKDNVKLNSNDSEINIDILKNDMNLLRRETGYIWTIIAIILALFINSTRILWNLYWYKNIVKIYRNFV